MINQMHQQERDAQPGENQQWLEQELMAEQLRRLVVEDLCRKDQAQGMREIDAERFRPQRLEPEAPSGQPAVEARREWASAQERDDDRCRRQFVCQGAELGDMRD
jgi:hypothetical protein